MLGLGSNITSISKTGKTIVKDGLVLRHEYRDGPVQLLSSGAASFVVGNTDHISCGDNLDVTTNDFSVCAWIKTTAASGTVLAKRSTGAGYELSLGNGEVSWYLNDGTGIGDTEDTIAVNDGEWHHIAWVFDRDGLAYRYIDGVNSGTNDSIAARTSSLTNDRNVGIGARLKDTPDNHFDGYVCNLGFWDNRVLTQPQIKSIMNKNYADLTSSETSDLVSWWNLDETLGDKGIVLDNNGAIGENLLANADFANGQDDWSGFGSVYTTLLNGVVTLDGTSGVAQLGQNILTNGSTYEVEFTITDHNGDATNSEIIQNNGGSLFAIPGNGVYKIHFTLAYANASMTFRAKSGSKFSISNISVKLVNGNHGTLS